MGLNWSAGLSNLGQGLSRYAQFQDQRKQRDEGIAENNRRYELGQDQQEWQNFMQQVGIEQNQRNSDRNFNRSVQNDKLGALAERQKIARNQPTALDIQEQEANIGRLNRSNQGSSSTTAPRDFAGEFDALMTKQETAFTKDKSAFDKSVAGKFIADPITGEIGTPQFSGQAPDVLAQFSQIAPQIANAGLSVDSVRNVAGQKRSQLKKTFSRQDEDFGRQSYRYWDEMNEAQKIEALERLGRI